MSYGKDLSDSAKDFIRCVFPAIQPCIGDGELILIESETTASLKQKLDIHSGIDAYQLNTDHGLRGIASRVQWGPFPQRYQKGYMTFTVRCKRSSGAKTEYEKRTKAINSNDGWLYPHFTVQAYLSERGGNGNLLSVGVIKTKILYETIQKAIVNGPPYKTIEFNRAKADMNKFIIVKWSNLPDCCIITNNILLKTYEVI